MQQTTFFQMAATLIPLLIFGGIVAENIRRWRPQPPYSKRDRRLALVLVVFVGLVPLLGEIVAIQEAVIGEPSVWDVRLVAFVLVEGTFGLLAVLLWPALAVLHAPGPGRKLLVGASVACFVLGGLLMVDTFTNSVRIVQVKDELAQAEQRVKDQQDQLARDDSLDRLYQSIGVYLLAQGRSAILKPAEVRQRELCLAAEQYQYAPFDAVVSRAKDPGDVNLDDLSKIAQPPKSCKKSGFVPDPTL
jgi:hypothetical protein